MAPDLLCFQLELANMLKTGQLKELWVVASQTHLQFNMVIPLAAHAESAAFVG